MHAHMKTDGREEIEERHRLRGGDRAGATAETAELGACGNSDARVDTMREEKDVLAKEEKEDWRGGVDKKRTKSGAGEKFLCLAAQGNIDLTCNYWQATIKGSRQPRSAAATGVRRHTKAAAAAAAGTNRPSLAGWLAGCCCCR